MNSSLLIFQDPATDQKLPQRVSGASFDEPSRRKDPERKYFCL